MEDGPARGGMDKADEVAPGEAMANQGNRAPATGRPDPPPQGLEPDAMFIDRPQFDLRVRNRGGDRS
jgi:hypothetical protein